MKNNFVDKIQGCISVIQLLVGIGLFIPTVIIWCCRNAYTKMKFDLDEEGFH